MRDPFLEEIGQREKEPYMSKGEGKKKIPKSNMQTCRCGKGQPKIKEWEQLQNRKRREACCNLNGERKT